jgi:beta-lactamase class A
LKTRKLASLHDCTALRTLILLTAIASFAGCRYDPSDMADALMQARVDTFVDSLEANSPGLVVGVYASDATTGWSYRREADRVFHAASTMKVPVMIEVFRQAEAGRFDLRDSLLVENRFSSIVDGSPYSMAITDDSDESLYSRIGKRMSVRDLVFQMITVSSNLATNILIDFVGADSVQNTATGLGTTTMRVLRGVEDIKAYEAGLSNTATAADLGHILERLASRDAVSKTADAEMLVVLRAQAFNEMIPAGLPAGTIVAHKTGSITRINHDAAIVSPDDRPWVLVILTEGVDNHDQSARMGSEIARTIHAIVRP